MRVAGLATSEAREEAQILPCWSRTLGPLSGDSGSFQTWPKVMPSTLMTFHL